MCVGVGGVGGGWEGYMYSVLSAFIISLETSTAVTGAENMSI